VVIIHNHSSWSADASTTFSTSGYNVRGTGPVPPDVPSMIANGPKWITC
jgi:hypothetical protein